MRIYFPAYGNTAQKGALEAAGIGAGEQDALEATMQIGEAIYRRLTQGNPAAYAPAAHTITEPLSASG